MKRIVGFILFASLLSVSCGKPNAKKSEGTAGSGHKEELIIGSAVDINNLNLQKQADQINNICLKLTHQGLFQLD